MFGGLKRDHRNPSATRQESDHLDHSSKEGKVNALFATTCQDQRKTRPVDVTCYFLFEKGGGASIIAETQKGPHQYRQKKERSSVNDLQG